MSSGMLTRVLFAGIAFMGAGVTVGAPQPEAVQVVVDYTDLDLSKPEGAATLYRRIKAAARTACGPNPDPHRLHERRLFEQCFEQAVAKAVEKVDRATLTALHRSRAGHDKVG
ncbi:MAG: UrcA family protein [Pseudomonadota bacterium]|jgi:hypothetical protein|nr:MAG: hypothetical protein DIU56_03535 [Pseudomonadota bacterium]